MLACFDHYHSSSTSHIRSPLSSLLPRSTPSSTNNHMMAMGGYFRAPRRRLSYGGWKQDAGNKESPRAALLVDDDESGGGDGVVPKGYFAVYVGAEATRFVVPTSYLRQAAFRGLMERAAEEFGFDQAGGLRIPCREEDFQATVAVLERRRRWRRTSATTTRSGGKTNNAMVKAC